MFDLHWDLVQTMVEILYCYIAQRNRVIKCIFDRLLSKYNRLDLSKVLANENYVKIIVICAIFLWFSLFLVPS